MSVKLRMKYLSGGRKSLYLDIYHNGKRHYDFLKLILDQGIKPSWQGVMLEESLPLLMESRGLQGLLAHQTISMESPPGEAHLPYPIRKTLPLLRDTTEKVFRSGKPESVGSS